MVFDILENVAFFVIVNTLKQVCVQLFSPLSIHLLRYANVVKASYRKSNSLVLRKFKMGAKAVGSRSIKIWNTRSIHTVRQRLTLDHLVKDRKLTDTHTHTLWMQRVQM